MATPGTARRARASTARPWSASPRLASPRPTSPWLAMKARYRWKGSPDARPEGVEPQPSDPQLLGTERSADLELVHNRREPTGPRYPLSLGPRILSTRFLTASGWCSTGVAGASAQSAAGPPHLTHAYSAAHESVRKLRDRRSRGFLPPTQSNTTRFRHDVAQVGVSIAAPWPPMGPSVRRQERRGCSRGCSPRCGTWRRRRWPPSPGSPLHSGVTSEDPAVGEGLLDGGGSGSAVELLGRCDRPGSEVRHSCAGEVERALQDARIGLDVAKGLANIPQRPRPDLAVVVHSAVEVLRVVQVGVDSPQAVRHVTGVRDRVPVGYARQRLTPRDAHALGDHVGGGHPPHI